MTDGRLHVGFVLTSLSGGGAERSTLRLAQSLIARGHRTDLVIPRFAGDYRAAIPGGMRVRRARIPGTDRQLLQAVQRSGVQVEAMTVNPFGAARTWLVLSRKYPGIPVIRGSGLRSIYPYAHFLSRYIREVRPQVLVSALPGPNAVAVCAAELTERAVPVVVTVWNNIAADYAPEWLAASRTLYPLADAVVAVSRGVAESVRRSLGVDAGRIRTIHSPIPASSIRRLAQDEVTHPWFADGAPPVVLCVGREARQKDHPTLVEAFGLARREVDSRLVILGKLSAPYRASLKSLARGHGVERDLGFVDFDENPYRYMRRAGLLAALVALGGSADGDPRGAGLRHAGGQHRRALWSARDPRGLGRPAAGGRRPGAGAGAGRDTAGREANGGGAACARRRLLRGEGHRRLCRAVREAGEGTRAVSTDKLHVGFLLTGLDGGGAERTMLNLAAAVIERGHRADLVIPRLAGDYRAAVPDGMRVWRARIPGTDRKLLRGDAAVGSPDGGDGRQPPSGSRSWLVLGRKGLDLPVRRRLRVYAYATMIARYVREARPQVLVSALPGADAAAVCAAELTDRAVPVVVTVHNVPEDYYAPEWLAAARTLYPLADAVVAVSRGVAESVQRSLAVDAERVRTIYNPIPADSIRRLAQAEVTHPWLADGEPPVVLSVGREAPSKDYPTLVRRSGWRGAR